MDLLHMAQSIALFRSMYIKRSRDTAGSGGSWRFLIMIHNYNYGRGIKPAVIAEYFRCTRAYVSKVIKELASGGLIEDRPDENDSRSRYLVCTKAGSDLAKSIMDDYVAMTKKLYDGLGKKKSAMFVRLLDEAIAILEKENKEEIT